MAQDIQSLEDMVRSLKKELRQSGRGASASSRGSKRRGTSTEKSLDLSLDSGSTMKGDDETSYSTVSREVQTLRQELNRSHGASKFLLRSLSFCNCSFHRTRLAFTQSPCLAYRKLALREK